MIFLDDSTKKPVNETNPLTRPEIVDEQESKNPIAEEIPIVPNVDVDKSQDQSDHDHSSDAHAGEGNKAFADMDWTEKLGAKKDYYMDPGHLFHHVQDANEFQISETTSVPVPSLGFSKDSFFRPTKFMALELFAALLLCAVFIGIARKMKNGERPKGTLWNMMEAVVVFIRDEIARPTIGSKEANQFMPFLLTIFFFILLLNLLGMIPFLGAATGSLAVTAVLAVITFAVVIGSGMKKQGVVGFLKAQVPHMDLPKAMAIGLIPAIWAIEIFGLFVKHFVLAVRLFANMFAGHLVLAVFVGFIGTVWGTMLVWGVAPFTVLAMIALSLLELFVAFLQAYVFTFLAALFIGAAQHPH